MAGVGLSGIVRTSRACTVVLILGLMLALAGPAGEAGATGGSQHGNRCRPSLRALPDLGGPFAEAMTFNRDHVFVGAAATPNEEHVFATYWRRDRIHTIATGLDYDEAYDINDSGLIVGNGFDPVSGDLVGWVYRKGEVHRLRGIGGQTFARRVNASGVIAGSVWTTDGVSKPAVWHRWWSDPQVLDVLPGDTSGLVSGINDAGLAVGDSIDADSLHAVLWDRHGHVQRLPTRPADGLDIGRAFQINSSRQVTGGLTDPLPTTPFHAVRWDGGTLIDIGALLGGGFAIGLDIAENGWVVGNSEIPDGPRKAFFWPGQGPMLALPSLSSDWATAYVSSHGIDSFGTASGMSTDDSGTDRATVWTCAQKLVEPSALATTQHHRALLPKAGLDESLGISAQRHQRAR